MTTLENAVKERIDQKLKNAMQLLRTKLPEVKKSIEEGHTARHIIKHIFNNEIGYSMMLRAYHEETGKELIPGVIYIKGRSSEKRNFGVLNKRDYETINFQEYKGKPIEEIPDDVVNTLLYHLVDEDGDYAARPCFSKAIQKF